MGPSQLGTHRRAGLESTDDPLKRVAEQSGFGSVDALQRCLRRHTGITPAEYRSRFARIRSV
ncbi:MAG: AraC family transcriptional regulator [Chitinophagaceae bacterium]|nr:AraC family transcriptional regulator [Rubrivivax sp.]